MHSMNSSCSRRFIVSVLVVGILFFHSTCLSEKAPYSTFAHYATQAPLVAYYDYIVVGGGTAGCALAATLSSKSNVLLLERGDLPYKHPTINNQATFLATLADVRPGSPNQPYTSTDGVYNSRARVLGGGSCLNAGFYTRASTAYVGRVGWDQKLVNESYEWVEKKVVFEPPMLQWQSAVRDGLLEVGVKPDNGFTYDHIYGTKVGGSIFDKTGHRHTAADLLEYADPTKITLWLNATVHQIYFQDKGGPKPRAIGVEFRDAKGNIHRAYLNQGSKNEVILSSGAIGSPQLLMLSGIGPKQHLAFHGIDLVLDQPNVGQGLSDNPMNGIIIPTREPVETSLIQVVGITKSESYIETGSAPLPVILQGLVNQTFHDFTKYFPDGAKGDLGVGMIVEKVAGPRSTGHLVLHSRDPNDNPIVTFNYFKDAVDLQRCVQGMKTIIEVIESNSFRKFRDVALPVPALIKLMLDIPGNARPRHPSSIFSLEQFCIDTVLTIWHTHGGCQVGKVVDSDYKVIGVDALRVIDGSTFINSPGTNPQATVMMLGRYMGQKILQARFPNG